MEGASVDTGVDKIQNLDSKNLHCGDSEGTKTDASFTEKTEVKEVTVTVPDRIKLNSGGNWTADDF